ncbi:MAG: divergent PAP2 family protein [Treponema sp.]|nr:divergent PAP2 family protein [Treponema sp.]
MPTAIPLKTSSLRALFENVIFLSTVSSLFIAQLLKAVIFLLSGRRKKRRELIEVIVWRTGGMPSSHSAVVTSLATSVAFAEGFSSNLFIIAFWFALVVVRDAMGVRRSAGLLARALNNLGRQTAEKMGIDFHAVKEIQGHTPLEVVVGGFLGIFIAAAFAFL